MISYLDSHLFEVFDCQGRKVFQPVFSVSKLGNLLVTQTQRPHDVPLESADPRFGHCFTLREEKELKKITH